LRKIHDVSRDTVTAGLEHRVLRDLNRLGIGPLGLGGRTTALGVKIGFNHRHPASYFVDVSVSCWADRRARLIWSGSSCRIMQ
jgi:tartrate dehydratase alpha subunit/fumarate hydratase class I-like protein